MRLIYETTIDLSVPNCAGWLSLAASHRRLCSPWTWLARGRLDPLADQSGSPGCARAGRVGGMVRRNARQRRALPEGPPVCRFRRGRFGGPPLELQCLMAAPSKEASHPERRSVERDFLGEGKPRKRPALTHLKSLSWNRESLNPSSSVCAIS